MYTQIYNQKSFCTLCSSCVVVVFIYYCCCCCCCIYPRSSSLHGRLLHCSGHQTEVVRMYIRMYVTHSDRSNGHVNPSNQGAAEAHLTPCVGSLEQRVGCIQYNWPGPVFPVPGPNGKAGPAIVLPCGVYSHQKVHWECSNHDGWLSLDITPNQPNSQRWPSTVSAKPVSGPLQMPPFNCSNSIGCEIGENPVAPLG